MGSGVQRVVTGSYVGTGSALNVRTVGFRPRVVEFLNPTGLTVCKWMNQMPDASVMKVFNHDTVQVAYATSNGITPLSDGFTVGTDADLNTADETVHFVAYE